MRISPAVDGRVDMSADGVQIWGMPLDSHAWVWGIRAAGFFHFVTLALASVTPIPPNWDENLAQLPEIHRRFAMAQNVFIGAVIAAAGLISLCFAPLLIEGTTLARVICACIALWWGGRLVVLPWLGAHRFLPTTALRIGYALLLSECALYTIGYGYLALNRFER